MNNNTIKINIVATDDKPVYNTVTINYKPVDITTVTGLDKEKIINALLKTLDLIVTSEDEVPDLHKHVNAINDYAKSIDCSSSTGKILQSDEYHLNVYYKKCTELYAGGLLVIAAHNILEAQLILSLSNDNIKEYNYKDSDWFIMEGVFDTGKPRVIVENSYSE